MGTGTVSPGVKRGQGVTLTTHPHLMLRSRMSRSYTSSPWLRHGVAEQLCVFCYLCMFISSTAPLPCLSILELRLVVWNSKAVPLPPCGRQGERKCSSYSFLTSALDGVSGQRHDPAALYRRGKDPQYPLERRLAGPQQVWTQRLEDKSFASAGDRLPVFQSVVSFNWCRNIPAVCVRWWVTWQLLESNANPQL
jgi:hypothetical protein